MINSRMPLTVLVLLLLILAGCSGGAGPMSPTDSGAQDVTAPAGDVAAQGWEADNYRVLWGLYDIILDGETGETEIVPVRGADYLFNVTMFLQPPAGNPANLGITIIDASNFMSQGLIDVNVNLTHPFAGLAKIRGFDVMGVFMSDGSATGYMDSSVRYPAYGNTDAFLRNADGYTRWMNASEFTQPGLLGFTPGSKGIPGFSPTSTINAFKYYAVGLGAEDDIGTYYSNQANIDERGSFTAGSTLSRRYELKFPMQAGSPKVRFQYAILASWAKPDPASLPNPEASDFPPEANMQEPFYIDVNDIGSTLYYAGPANLGGDLWLSLEIFDWQGVTNPAGIAGEISHIYVEDAAGSVIPGGYVDVLPSAAVTAGKANSSVFTFDIANCTPIAAGRQDFLITVESASPTDYDQGFGSPYPSGALLSMYKRFSFTVGPANPCPSPNVTGPTGTIFNINDIVTGYAISGTGFMPGTQLAMELQRMSGDIIGTNVSVSSPISAISDFDLTGATAGKYDLYFMNGCGNAAPIALANQVEVNTPPTSTGITGPASGDGTLGIVQYNANATDADTDPVDTLAYSWTVVHQPTGIIVLGPVGGDPLNVDFSTLSIAAFDINCTVSDGYVPADLSMQYTINRTNTQPVIGMPTGSPNAWYNSDVLTYKVTASDMDVGQTLTYMWSMVPQSSAPSFVIPGDPIPGNVTIDFDVVLPGPGWYDLQCEVDDGSSAPNAKAQSGIYQVYAADSPYRDMIPLGRYNQMILQGTPASQGVVGCPSFWDTFYGPLAGFPFVHPDVSILSGPSLGTPGVMVIADELGALVGAMPIGVMGFAHFTSPYSTGSPMSWWWFTTGLFGMGGPDMIPSPVHFDGTSSGEMFISNSQLTNKLAGFGVPDMSAFSHYMVGAGPAMNDLFTSLPGANRFDVAVDTSNGFDMGSPSSPMTPPLYGLYTQDLGGIILSCGGPAPGALAANPINIIRFPSFGVQPVGLPVDAPGSAAVVAPIPVALMGVGPGFFNILPGWPCPAGVIIYPEPYYALGVDDDPADNPFMSNLPLPVTNWVIAAAIDSERDVELYEMDFGVAPPGPAPILPLATIPMGSFLGGSATAFPVDLEFISNFSGFSGSPKPTWNDDLLAVLITDPNLGAWVVEIYDLIGGNPILISQSMPVPVPAGFLPVPGTCYRLDVDEVTGDICVLHTDAAGTASLAVTIIPY